MSPILSIVFALGAFVCWIIILVKLFQAGYTMQGVIGIFCGLIAFIYGWSKADEMDAKPIMLIWTGCIVAYLISIVASAAGGGTPLPQ